MRAMVWGILPSAATPAQNEPIRLLYLYRGGKGSSARGSFDKKATKVINGIILKQGYVRLDACWWHVITDDG